MGPIDDIELADIEHQLRRTRQLPIEIVEHGFELGKDDKDLGVEHDNERNQQKYRVGKCGPDFPVHIVGDFQISRDLVKRVTQHARFKTGAYHIHINIVEDVGELGERIGQIDTMQDIIEN